MKTAVLTIGAGNYFGRIATLMESLGRWEPTWHRHVLWTESGIDSIGQGEDQATILDLDQIGIGRTQLSTMRSIYNVTEFSTSLKPFAMSYLHRNGYDRVVYLDPDTLVFRPLVEVSQALDTHQVILTPHTLDPVPHDGFDPTADEIRAAGSFNLGFIASSIEAISFLDWWGSELVLGAVNRTQDNLFTDQRWMDQAPSYCSVGVLRDVTYNVAYWNLHERFIAKGTNGITINGRPLAFFHFSGFDPAKPWILTRHSARPRVTTADRSELLELCHEYGARVRKHDASRSLHSREGSGSNVHSEMITMPRWLQRPIAKRLRFEYTKGDLEFPEANSVEDVGVQFLHSWLASAPNESGNSGISRLAWLIWSDRPDLQAAFPDIRKQDRANFEQWCVSQEASDIGVVCANILKESTLRASSKITQTRESLVPTINVVGYFQHSSGIGETARGICRVLREHGWVVNELSLDESSVLVRRTDSERLLGHPTIWCVNADCVSDVIAGEREVHQSSCANFGYWFWETSKVPRYFEPASDFFDQIWAPSSFIHEALRASIDSGKLKQAPTLLNFDLLASTELSNEGSDFRAEFGIPEAALIVLSRFDFRSVLERKNPFALIDAFRSNYKNADSHYLLLKSINGRDFPEELQSLADYVRIDQNIRLIDRDMSREEGWQLLQTCDIFASLHRSEGLGLNIAEAMFLGKPVVVSAYSGNMDFCTSENSYLVDGRVIDIPESGGSVYAGLGRWFDPSQGSARKALRLATDDLRSGQSRGALGKSTVELLTESEEFADFVSKSIHETKQNRRGIAELSGLRSLSALDAMKSAEFQIIELDTAFSAYQSGTQVGIRGWLRHLLYKFSEMNMWYQRRLAEQMLKELRSTIVKDLRIREAAIQSNELETNVSRGKVD